MASRTQPDDKYFAEQPEAKPKDCVGLNFFAAPETLTDPKKKLEGNGKKSRMLKVHGAADIDSASILRWLKAAAKT